VADIAGPDDHAVQPVPGSFSAAELRKRIDVLDRRLGFLAAPLPPGQVPAGPFAGVPLLVKDLDLRMRDTPLWRGNAVLRSADVRCHDDDQLARTLRDSGFDVVGRTKSSEFGLAVTTEPIAYGPVRNPWHTGHTAGGSSGGSACAVAAGAVPIAHGTDLGGSLRVPAAHCGVFAIKPGIPQRVSRPSLEPWSVHGFVTANVQDAHATTALLGVRPQAHATPRKLRVGVLNKSVSSAGAISDEYRTAMDIVAGKLSDAGHDVQESYPMALDDYDEYSARSLPLVASGLATQLAEAGLDLGRPLTPEDLEPATAQVLSVLPKDSDDVARAMSWVDAKVDSILDWWNSFDVLVSPTVPVQAPELGWYSDPETSLARTLGTVQYTAYFNATSQPAVSVPLYLDGEVLPLGVQLVGDFGSEHQLLDLAGQIQPGPARAAPQNV
jgi:amidase